MHKVQRVPRRWKQAVGLRPIFFRLSDTRVRTRDVELKKLRPLCAIFVLQLPRAMLNQTAVTCNQEGRNRRTLR